MTSLKLRMLTTLKTIPLFGAIVLFIVQINAIAQAPYCGAQGNDLLIEGVEVEVTPAENRGPDFLRPMINVELSLVKRVCEVTDDQMTAIVAAAKDAHIAMSEIVRKNDPFENDEADVSKLKFVSPEGEWLLVNPYKRVRQDVAKLLKPLVTEQQYAKYAEEIRARDEYEHETVIGLLIDILDARLVLSGEQREQLNQKLKSDLTDVDLHWLDAYDMNSTSIPFLPDHLFIPILSGSQQKQLASQKRDNVILHVYDDGTLEFAEEWLTE